jgi:hypothetical protein
MGGDYVMVWEDDVILIERCDSRREAYKIAIAHVIKCERGAMPDRGSIHPPATRMELKQASCYFRQKCQLLAVNCYL